MSAHALLAPSAAHRWMRCGGALAASVDEPDDSSEFAREGTAAHELGECALKFQRPCTDYLGIEIKVPYEEDGKEKVQKFEVDDEMCEYVQVYVDQVMREPGELIVEEKLDLSEVYKVPDQFGTGDAIVLDHENNRLYVGDLKYGQGEIVYAEDNEQLYSYGAGALLAYDMLGDWQKITVAIHQPRLHHYDEHTLTRAELEEFIEHAQERAAVAVSLIGDKQEAIEAAKVAGDKQCRWCPIRGRCSTLATWTHEQVFADFTSLGAEPSQVRDASQMDDATLDKLIARCDAIEGATRAWRSELTRRLEGGIYKGAAWKLVEGRAGNRKWSDEDEAEKIMKGARIKKDEMFSMKLLSFPQAEKKFKKSKPRVWAKLAALMSQAPGKPAVAPINDPKPALVIAKSEQFSDVSDTPDVPDDIADLF